MDPRQRHSLLRDYFCDKDATALLTSEGWILSLNWSSDVDRYVDPLLDEALGWWGSAIRCKDMFGLQHRHGKVLSMLYDTWTAHSWSEWIIRTNPERISEVLVLHVDDHRDMGSPRLFVKSEHFVDAITGESVLMSDPSSIKSSIMSGAVGMGSFMTPFLHEIPSAEIRHLCQPPKVVSSEIYCIRPGTITDTLLQPEAVRPSIQLEVSTDLGPGKYLQTSNPMVWIADIVDRPILLHIDMDYFNNRYDGDSDWHVRQNGLDPPPEMVFDKINILINTLKFSNVGRYIEDVTIALSPGFFPAELWKESYERLRKGINEVLS